VTKVKMIFVNLVTPKAGVKQELLVNKPASESGLLYIKSYLSIATKCG
jgi:hypothetical protein